MGEDTLLEKIIKRLEQFFCRHKFELVEEGKDCVVVQCEKCLKQISAKKKPKNTS